MTSGDEHCSAWVQRAVERSAAVQRSRSRIAVQVRQMLDAARTLIEEKGDEFTTQELAARAGVALQTFYRYFTSKDELLLAVIGDACEGWAQTAASVPDPMDRMRFFIVTTLDRFGGDPRSAAMAKFVVSMRWRLHRQFPQELAEAERPIVDMLRETIDEAAAAGLLKPLDAQWDSWFIGELVRSVFHFYAFADPAPGEMDTVKEQVWRFCLNSLGGTVVKGEGL